MNIAEILKYCPKGTKLYSLIDGETTLESVNITNRYPIETITSKFRTDFVNNYYTKDGLFLEGCNNGECLLFPSKEQRDWQKFRLPVERGDIMMNIDGKFPFIATGEMHKDISPKYICGINSLGYFQKGSNEGGWIIDFYIPASEEVKKELFDKMAEAGYKWNADTLELEKIEPKFKEGDIKKSQKTPIKHTTMNTSISMNFGKAIEALKAGSAIRRSGWNGKGLFVVKQIPTHITVDSIPNIPNMQSLPQSAKNILMNRENPHIDYTNQMLIINPDGRADSWVPSSSDVFAEDWEVVDE